MLTLTNNPDKVLLLASFFNIKKIYDTRDNCPTKSLEEDCSLRVGTVIEETNINRVFKNNFHSHLTFDATKGKGKENLLSPLKKCRESGIQYVFLEAGGGEGLVNLYKKYGFFVLVKQIMVNILEDEWFLGNTIMFNTVEYIIATLEQQS